jgi:hypothetical protein
MARSFYGQLKKVSAEYELAIFFLKIERTNFLTVD